MTRKTALLLFGNAVSPFTRIVRVMAAETGMSVDLRLTKVHPGMPDDAVVHLNPSGRIPSAVTPGGVTLHDSRAIARWIATHPDATRRLYPEGDALWPVLRREAMAHAALDAAVLIRYELHLRPTALRWPDWIEWQNDKLRRFVAAIAQDIPTPGEVDAAAISVACVLEYLDFRHADLSWRDAHQELADWAATISTRRAMIETVPSEPQ